MVHQPFNLHGVMRFFMESPLCIFLLVFALSFLLVSRLRLSIALLRAAGVVCGAASTAVFLLTCLLNLRRSGFLMHDEVNLISVASAYLSGQPMYHARSASDFYALLYGPSTFLAFLPPLALSAHPLSALRLTVTLVLIANVALFYLILRTWLPRASALALLPIATTGLLLPFPGVLFGPRGDGALLLCLSAALLFALRNSWLLASLASGILCGLALDFKVSILPVVCLLLAILWRRHGTRALLLAASASILSVLSLFLLPRISLGNYVDWLHLASRQSLLGAQFVTNLLAALSLVAGGLLLRRFGAPPTASRRNGVVVPLFAVLALAACVLTAAKDGAGEWHLWPMLPFVLAWTACEAATRSQHAGAPSPRTASVLLAICLAATLVSLRLDYRAIGELRVFLHPAQRTAELTAQAELTALSRRFPGGQLAMGYGADAGDPRSGLRFELPLLGEAYFLDENAVVETIKERLPIPENVIQRVERCGPIWLIPHGETPFSTLRDGVLTDTSIPWLFPDAIRLGFPRTHVLVESGPTYDLWACPTTP